MPHLFLSIADLEDEFASAEELDVRSKLEDAITRSGIGTITGSGSGFGEMDLSIQVDDVAKATSALHKLAAQFGLASRMTIREAEEDDQADEDRRFLKNLDAEVGPQACRSEGCTRLQIKRSVFCKLHHFRQIFGRDPNGASTV